MPGIKTYAAAEEAGSHSGADAKPRVDWVDYAKGVGILLVVIGHVLRGLSGDGLVGGQGWARLVDNWIYAFHMPLFFFLSGLFATRALRDPAGSFLVKRLQGIAYPYVLWILITGVIRSLVYSGTDATMSFLQNYWRIVYQPYDIYWFLYALFLISVGYYFLRRAGLSTLALAIVFLGVYGLFKWVGMASPWRPADYFCLYGVYFAGGALFADNKLGQRLQASGIPTQVILAVAGVGLVTWMAVRHLLTAGNPVVQAAAAGIIAVVILSQWLEKWGKADVVRRWGTLSLQIYVVHTIVGAAVRLMLVQIGITATLPHLVLGVGFGLYVPILLYHLGNRIGFPYLFSLKR